MFKPGKKVEIKSAKELPPTPASLADTTFNLTGSWRNLKPIINYEGCVYCMICWKFCPEPAIYLEDGSPHAELKPVIDYNFCKGCGICVEECPTKCIDFVEEGK